MLLAVDVRPDDLHRTWSVADDALRDAPQQKAFETGPPMRSDDNQVCGPRCRRVENGARRIAFRSRFRAHHETRGAQSLGDAIEVLVSGTNHAVARLQDVPCCFGPLRKVVRRRQMALPLDRLKHLDLAVLRRELGNYGLDRRLGELRRVEGQKDLHHNTVFLTSQQASGVPAKLHWRPAWAGQRSAGTSQNAKSNSRNELEKDANDLRRSRRSCGLFRYPRRSAILAAASARDMAMQRGIDLPDVKNEEVKVGVKEGLLTSAVTGSTATSLINHD
jgi:hypothetical protein